MIPAAFLLIQASEVSALGVAKRGKAGWTDGELVGPTIWRFLHRPEKDGAATRVDAICMHRPDPKGPGLDREQLYWELSHLTHGVTLLGPYTLDRDSLYVNGEPLRLEITLNVLPLEAWLCALGVLIQILASWFLLF